MKNIYLILTILFLFTGCNKEEVRQEENSILNKWHLMKFELGLFPTENFNKGEITWFFQQNNKLKVEINNSISSPPIKLGGEYKFLLNENRISINNVEYDFSINENTLIISDDHPSNGFKATFFKKIE